VVEPWLSALIVALAVALVGALLLSKGLSSLKGHNLKPQRTIDTLRGNARWAKEQLR
jgi:hypothetical protein